MTYVKAAAMQKRAPLNNDEKAQWNSFVDYLDKRGMKGNVALDNRDTGLGQQLLNEYKAQDPHFTLGYDKVSQIQQDLQDYRGNMINKWKANPAIIPDVKTPDEIMPNLSPSDGWLGSKTSLHKYPTATLTNNGVVQNYGVNTAAYDAAMANIKNVK